MMLEGDIFFTLSDQQIVLWHFVMSFVLCFFKAIQTLFYTNRHIVTGCYSQCPTENLEFPQCFTQRFQAFPVFDGKIAEMFQCLLMAKMQKDYVAFHYTH